MSEKVEWCSECGRAKTIGCACSLTFAEKMKSLQIDRFGLLDRDRKLKEPKNKGLQRKLK